MELKFKKCKEYGWTFESNEIQIKNKLYRFEYKNYYGFSNHIKPWLNNTEKANFVLYTYEYCAFDKRFILEDSEGIYFRTKKEMISYLENFLREGLK